MIDRTELYRRFKALEYQKRRALAAKVGYANLPAPSYRLLIAIERQASYARVAARFAEHLARVDESLQPRVTERIAA